MKFGLAIMNDFPPGTVPADRVAQLREQVRAAAQSGIDSVWVLQHYLGNMPTLQPLPLLSALAADAGDMRLGTNMFILPLRHPVAVAEEFATLDHLTGGRAVAGFGMGYRENEFASFGVGLEERVGRFEESIEIIRALWTGEAVSFAGRHFTVEGQQISLPPVQPGGPRIWIGAGAHRTGAHRAARLGDAWIVPPHVSPDRLKVVLGYYLAERERLGRHGPADLVVRRELVLDDVRLPDDALLPEAKGLKGPLSCLSEARYGIIWGSMGAARSAWPASPPLPGQPVSCRPVSCRPVPGRPVSCRPGPGRRRPA